MTPIAIMATWYGKNHWVWAVHFTDSERDQQGTVETIQDAMANIIATLAVFSL